MGTANLFESKYTTLIKDIGCLLANAHTHISTTINNTLVTTYWHIGKYIVEFEQGGEVRAEYGSELINRLSKDLTLRYGKGFSRSNLIYIRKFYLNFQKGETVSHLLTWSHYFEILKADNELEISFYTKQCERERWSVRELKRQMKSMLFHRLALSTDKEGVMALAEKGQETIKPQDIIRDPMVLDFLGLPVIHSEKKLEKAILDNLQTFLLELGRGFAFVGRQQHIMIGGRHFYVDLVFYHCILKTYILIDLKTGMVRHENIGQMNLYLNYYKHEICTEGDSAPIGIVLGAYKDDLTVEYATEGINNNLFVSKYQLYLPDAETLKKELKRLL
ncbi:MAG: PDDEXK nuclease domain-containing protein [Bacteroidales bacterium]|nr:PDDEXK nuclease domain-containing protein [Bacteroidales bacterium]